MEKWQESLLRDYAAGEVTWREVRAKGIDNYLDVLAGLGELGLRPPVAPMDGVNVASRERSRAIIRAALVEQGKKGLGEEDVGQG